MSTLNEIHRCRCENDYQDAKYGSKMRVMNWSSKSETWRCTVCGTLKQKGGVVSIKSYDEKSSKKGKKTK